MTANNNIKNQSNTTTSTFASPTPAAVQPQPQLLTPSTAVINSTTNLASANDSRVQSISPIELSENFYINNNKKVNVKIQVKLNGEGIYLRRETEQSDQINEQLIRIEDVIGSRCGPRMKKPARGGLSSCKRITEDDQSTPTQSNEPKDISAFLYVYAYVRKEKPFQRYRTLRILRFRSYGTYEENLKCAQRWHHAIRVNKSINEHRSMEDDKQVLILLNPKSGSGKGREMFQKQVAPILKEAEIQYDLQVTTHANYARELVRKRADILSRYNGIIVAAGDGLFHEVLNGIMERQDWYAVAHRIPIGIIPCGSGNGLAKSIAHLYKEPYEPKPILNATLTCISGHSTPLDVVRIDLASGKKTTVMYSFLSIGWGLIADIDIESERLRSIGAPRFTIWSIHRLISLRTYKGKLSYIPWRKGEGQKPVIHDDNNLDADAEDGTNSQQQAFYDALEDQIDDEFADAISIDQRSFQSNVNSWHSASSRRTAYYSIGGHSMRSQTSRRTSMLNKIEAANAKFQTKMLKSSIPPLDTPVPPEIWHCEEDDYVMVHAAYTTHLGSDCYFAPESQFNDGVIYLVIIRKGIGRTQLVQFLLGMSTGTHIPEQPNEYVQIVPVRAFRIEPQGDGDGIMAVDGERVDYGTLQAEMFPGLVKVMVPNGK